MRRSIRAGASARRSAPDGGRRVKDPAVLGVDVLAGLVRTLADGMLVLDSDFRCVYANPAACKLLGCPSDTLIGNDCLLFVPEREQESALALLSKARSAGAIVAHRPDGSEHDIEVRATRLDLPGRRVVVVLLRDMSERSRRWKEAIATAQGAASVAIGDSIEATAQALAECALQGTRALATWLTVDDQDEPAAWVGAAGLQDGFLESIRESVVARPLCPAFLQALVTQRLVVFADARRQVEAEPSLAGLVAALRPLPWQAAAFAPLLYRGSVVGILAAVYREGQLPTEAETTFLAAVAGQAATAAANARLVAAAREKVALEERQRLAWELHDSISQALYGIELEARMARERLDRDPDRVAQPIEHLVRLAEAGQAEMRALIFELRPGSLAAEGLVATLNRQIEVIRARHGIAVQTITRAEPEAPIEVKEALYRIAQEALRNAVKHARARRIDVRLEERAGGMLVVEVADDGVGFDPGGHFPGHLGLHSMRERALAVGGSLDVVSSRGHGTRVTARVPVVSPSPVRRRGLFAQQPVTQQRRIRSAV